MTDRHHPTRLEHADLTETTPLEILIAWMDIGAAA